MDEIDKALQRCQECINLIKKAGFSIKENNSPEAIDNLEFAYQRAVHTVLNIEEILLKVPAETERIESLQRQNFFDDGSFLVPEVMVNFDQISGLSCRISSPPILKKSLSKSKYSQLLMDSILFEISSKIPVVERKFEQAVVIFISYVASDQRGKTLYYDNDNIAIKRLLDIVVPRICIDDAACFCDNFYITQTAEQMFTELHVLEKKHLKQWINQHSELDLFHEKTDEESTRKWEDM